MKKFSKKIISAFVAATMFGGLNCTPCIVSAANIIININETQNAGSIDWHDGFIVAYGVGRADERGAAMSREAAIMAAQRNLVGILKGMSIDSDTTMRDLIIESDVVNRKITGVLRGAEIIDEGQNSDGSYYVQMRVPMWGVGESIASSIVPELTEKIPQPFSRVTETSIYGETFNSFTYTGVVIDASGLGLEPTFSPVIYDTNGRAVYGIKNLRPDAVISRGMVDYSDSLKEATAGGRAGNNPLVIKAESVGGGKNSVNSVNVIVSVEDADKILLANEKSHMLDNCAVIFVK